METIYYIGLDVHKKAIAYCIKRIDGETVRQGIVGAERNELRQWVADLPGPWMGAMEATIFTGWIYDFLEPHAVELKVAHPEMVKAITAAKKKKRGRHPPSPERYSLVRYFRLGLMPLESSEVIRSLPLVPGFPRNAILCVADHGVAPDESTLNRAVCKRSQGAVDPRKRPVCYTPGMQTGR